MQLYALDQNLTVIYSKNASKHHNYKCLECQSLVRLRGGIHRQNHFYHIDPNRTCRQNGKSMEHLQVQIFLQSQLTENDCILEKRFKEINRIADVVCTSKKIIFEVQCSPISAEEVRLRNRDYGSLGYYVVWIFHEQRFNQSRLQAAEQFLQNHLHYFTNIDASGNGIIYDQFRLFEKGRQIFASRTFPIDVKISQEINKKNHVSLEHKLMIPDLLLKKVDNQTFCFKGDLIAYCGSDDFQGSTFAYAIKILNSRKPVVLTYFQKIQLLLIKFIARPYKIIFRMLLEKASF